MFLQIWNVHKKTTILSDAIVFFYGNLIKHLEQMCTYSTVGGHWLRIVHQIYIAGDPHLLKEMILSIPLHVTDTHEFPGNVHHKVFCWPWGKSKLLFIDPRSYNCTHFHWKQYFPPPSVCRRFLFVDLFFPRLYLLDSLPLLCLLSYFHHVSVYASITDGHKSATALLWGL